MIISPPPTQAGFNAWVASYMAVPSSALPPSSDALTNAYTFATDWVLPVINTVSPLQYTAAVYNLGGALLVQYAPDQPGQTYFADLRTNLKLNSFEAGVVASSGDEGTSVSLQVAEGFKNLSVGDLELLKSPWGRTYLNIAQQYGPLWGLS